MNSTLNATRSNPAAVPDFRVLKSMLGVLAVVAAGASAIGVTMTASLFGALAAGALSAGAAFAALFEPARCGWRLGVWIALGASWMVVAANLLSAPMGHLDGMRILMSALIAASAALRASRWQIRQSDASPGVVGTLVFALMALAVTWSGAWAQGTDPAAISLGCSLELAGSGCLWLAEAVFSRRQSSTAGGVTLLAAVPATVVRLA